MDFSPCCAAAILVVFFLVFAERPEDAIPEHDVLRVVRRDYMMMHVVRADAVEETNIEIVSRVVQRCNDTAENYKSRMVDTWHGIT